MPIGSQSVIDERTDVEAYTADDIQEVPRSLEQVYLKVMTDAQALYGEALHA